MHEDFKTEEWKNLLKKLPKLEELKRLLREFSESDYSKNSVEEIEKEYFNKVNLYPGISRLITSNEVNLLKVFRIRKNINTDEHNICLASTFSYPSSSNCKRNGRANIPKHPVFYCSDNLNTSFLEVKPEPNDIMFVSYWKVQCDRESNFYPILANNLTETNPWKTFADSMYEKLIKSTKEVGEDKAEELTLLYNAFSYWFRTEDDPYSKTSWFSHKCLYKTNGIDFLVYPSYVTYQNTCSMAIHPNFVDNFLRLEKVVSFQLDEYKETKLNDIITSKFKISITGIGKPSLTNINWSTPTKQEAKKFEEDLLKRS